MNKELVKLANHLDNLGHRDLANRIDAILKAAQDMPLRGTPMNKAILKDAGMWGDFTNWGAEQVIAGVKGITEAAGYAWKPSYEDKLLSECTSGVGSCGALFGKLSVMAIGDLLDWLTLGLTEPITPHPSFALDSEAQRSQERMTKAAGMWGDFTNWGAEQVIAGVKGITEAAGYAWKPSYEDRLLSECNPASGGGAGSCGMLFGKLSVMAIGDLLDWLTLGLTEPITPHPSFALDSEAQRSQERMTKAASLLGREFTPRNSGLVRR